MSQILPPELWSYIFSLASDEDLLLYPGLPTSFALSSWDTHALSQLPILRTPHDALCILQRRAYITKTSVVATCKAWRGLGTEVLARCLFFDDPAKLRRLAAVLAVDPERGWWTRRLHITHFGAGRAAGAAIDKYADALRDVVQNAPNLEIFIVDWPMAACFGAIADTLGMYCHSLRTAHWHVPVAQVPKVIWALDTLTNLVSVHLQFSPSSSAHPLARVAYPPTSDEPPLGAAESVHLALPALQQLSLLGHAQLFIEQATGWSLPALRSFSFNFGAERDDLPDVVGFLAAHGAQLAFLDLDCVPALDVPTILDLCPVLTTFCFNPDWRLPSPAETQGQAHPQTPSTSTWTLTNRPHAHITHIGLHGLLFAFGVGYAASAEPTRRLVIQRTNDVNFTLLASRAAFPRLERVRVLSRTVLEDLERENGPGGGRQGDAGEGCWERWERWCEVCEGLGVRLEDCTGALLGALPRRRDDEDEDEEASELGEGEEYEYEYYYEDEDGEEYEYARVTVSELRQLLEECRQMSAEREETLFAPGVVH
ncbi:hypothetical protein BV22DRAFT_1107950 [Leucogyrophana mollusca]|uniref:Uncharacterized protein n=1 Tax=Leucogyrophana mollusca TaxID=85980 RepID=A0ACB8B2S8_9AGAM|nr:hypothetical protein BV22DRAFT_1107950 [Leucogyrophana mollusca]